MIPVSQPLLGDEEKRSVLDVLDSGMLADGEIVRLFEQEFAQFTGSRYAVATTNGTTALHAALLAYDIGVGDEVITTPFSFIATANAIRATGARPVFVDIDEKTFNLDVTKIESAITEKTKAILPVHLYGNPASMKSLQEIAERHNIHLIQDAAQSHAAKEEGMKLGEFGTACFSFYPTKNMTTGEGGMVVTNNEEISKNLRLIVNHGSEIKYSHKVMGFNFRMTNIAAAIGREQLKKLPYFTKKRQQNALRLNEGLKDIRGIKVPEYSENHVFHQYTVRVTSDFHLTRKKVQEKLAVSGIGSAIHYPIPIHKQETFSEFNDLTFPVTEKVSSEVLSIPCHPGLSEEDVTKIIEVIKGLQ